MKSLEALNMGSWSSSGRFPELRSHAVDEELLHCLQGGVVITESPHDGGEDVFQCFRARFTLGGILCTILDDPAARHKILHVHVGTPCRQHHWVVAVDETVVSCSEHGWLSILCHEGCLRLQGLGVAKSTLLLAITSTQAVGS